MNNCKSFPPSVDNRSKILILGSMPGVKSLEEQQYYAHPQNRFWKVLARILDEPDLAGKDYQEKLRILLENKVALWDTIKTCKRAGSLDLNIQDEVLNNIGGLLKKYKGIRAIFLNGNKSYTVFWRHFADLAEKYECKKLPSTSPANARYSLDKLVENWEIIREFIRP